MWLIIRTLLTDHFKAFDCLPHELIIVKLKVYGFSLPALRLIQDFLSNRQQRTKINNACSSWEEVLFGVTQSSLLGLILLSIFLGDLFLTIDENKFASYAKDNTIYRANNTIEDVALSLQEFSKNLFKWFSDNEMQGDSENCHLILTTDEPAKMQVGESLIKGTKSKKLLGVKIDSKFTFDKRIKIICEKGTN